jgi:hypothetical protein
MNSALNSAINLVTLLLGIGIGLLLAPRIETKVSAQTPPAATPSECVDSATVECVSPVITAGTAGFGKVLANQIATDQLTVGGYDIMKLQNNVLTALVARGAFTDTQARSLVEASHPPKQLRFRPPAAPPQAPPK